MESSVTAGESVAVVSVPARLVLLEEEGEPSRWEDSSSDDLEVLGGGAEEDVLAATAPVGVAGAGADAAGAAAGAATGLG
ncbi:hypothetical protein FRC01_008749 [Tulasnella sp. 417]|nr:hypothetical protein FRC01_008749 [Tulasnella sp. 417]